MLRGERHGRTARFGSLRKVKRSKRMTVAEDKAYKTSDYVAGLRRIKIPL